MRMEPVSRCLVYMYGFAVISFIQHICMMTSKAEYLKRYMSDDSVVKKKKKEKIPLGAKSR